MKSNVTVHKSRGGWSHQSELAKRAQVLPARVEALAASLEVQSFAGKLEPKVVWPLVSGSDFGLEFSVLRKQRFWATGQLGFELSRFVCSEAPPSGVQIWGFTRSEA